MHILKVDIFKIPTFQKLIFTNPIKFERFNYLLPNPFYRPKLFGKVDGQFVVFNSYVFSKVIFYIFLKVSKLKQQNNL